MRHCAKCARSRASVAQCSARSTWPAPRGCEEGTWRRSSARRATTSCQTRSRISGKTCAVISSSGWRTAAGARSSRSHGSRGRRAHVPARDLTGGPRLPVAARSSAGGSCRTRSSSSSGASSTIPRRTASTGSFATTSITSRFARGAPARAPHRPRRTHPAACARADLARGVRRSSWRLASGHGVAPGGGQREDRAL